LTQGILSWFTKLKLNELPDVNHVEWAKFESSTLIQTEWTHLQSSTVIQDDKTKATFKEPTHDT